MSVNEDIKAINRRLDQVIKSYDQASASVSSFDNGEELLFTITTTADNGAKLLVSPDISLYIGSVADANALPGGSGIDESQWQVIGPWNDWGGTNNENVVTRLYVRNISAGSVTILLRVISRVIPNSPTPEGALS